MKFEYFIFILMTVLVLITSVLRDVGRNLFYFTLLTLSFMQILLIAALNIKRKRGSHGILTLFSLVLVMIIIIAMFIGVI
ncbi:MAG: hypothetical protein DRO15_06970 [Thermoprotei archaeon]|nr:MAG: hypothetical protein DRO15_06970 [Thermoprotei archaeon]